MLRTGSYSCVLRDGRATLWAIRTVGTGPPRSQDFPVVIASVPASKQERMIAFGLIAFVWLAFAMVVPFAHLPLARIDAFVPVLQTVMCIVDLITAVLLFAQYSIVPKRALLAVACGYVFSGMFAFLQTLAFPGAYSPSGLIGDGVSTAAWFFVLWHGSFALSVVVYTLLKDADDTASVSHVSTATAIAVALACTFVATAALTWLVTLGAGYMPAIYVGTIQQTQFARNLNVFLLSLQRRGIRAVVLSETDGSRHLADRDLACVVAKLFSGYFLYRSSV